MARGWESKAVEDQQNSALEERHRPAPASAGERAHQEARAGLLLARTRALADLQQACRPAHRAMLEQAIADLDRRLAALD
jgi:hypothetical protein